MPETVRVQKALADAGVASRRAADALVAAGRVTVNGQPAVTGQRVDPAVDALAVDGRPVVPAGRRTYLVMHKPAGVTSTVSDRHAEETVLDLVPDELRRSGHPAVPGRPPRQGLRGPHPAHRRRRLGPAPAASALRRRARVRGRVCAARSQPRRPRRSARASSSTRGWPRWSACARPPASRQAGSSGRDDPRPPLAWYRAVLTQGWKRQLRRMFAAIGAPGGAARARPHRHAPPRRHGARQRAAA